MARVLTITLNPALDLSIQTGTVVLGAVNRSDGTRLDAAGKGINVARVLAALGHEVGVSGLLGADNEAAFIRAFADHGLRDAFVRVPGDTRVNVKLSEQGGRVTELNGSGPAIPAAAMDALTQTVSQLLAGLDAVVIAGSLPPRVTAPRLAALVRAIREAGVTVWLDTSGEALHEGLAAQPDGVKPNEIELGEMLGTRLGTAEARQRAARLLQASGITNVLVSAGAGQVIWARPEGLWRAQPPKVPVVNTVGAGDTLLAGALHGLLSGWAPEPTLRFATALSAEAVRHVGVGNAEAPDFAELLQDTVVQANRSA